MSRAFFNEMYEANGSCRPHYQEFARWLANTPLALLEQRLTRSFNLAGDDFLEMARFLVVGSLLAAAMQTVVLERAALEAGLRKAINGGQLHDMKALLEGRIEGLDGRVGRIEEGIADGSIALEELVRNPLTTVQQAAQAEGRAGQPHLHIPQRHIYSRRFLRARQAPKGQEGGHLGLHAARPSAGLGWLGARGLAPWPCRWRAGHACDHPRCRR